MNYNDLTWARFQKPSNAGRLTRPLVRRGVAGSWSEGTWVQFELGTTLGPGGVTVESARFLAFGCPHVIAVSDWIAELAVGLPLRPSLPEPVEALRRRFGVPVEKLGRILRVEDAWIAAISSPDSPPEA